MKIIEIVPPTNAHVVDEGAGQFLLRKLGKQFRPSRAAAAARSAHQARRAADLARGTEIINSIGANTKKLLIAANVGTAAYYALWKPWQTYDEQMGFAQTRLNAKDPSERWTEQQYELFHQKQLMMLLTNVGASYVGYFLLKIPSSMLTRSIFGREITEKIMLLSKPALMYIGAEMGQNSDLAKALGAYILKQLNKGPVDIEGSVTAYLAQLAVDGEAKLQSLVGAAERQRPASDPSTSAPDQQPATDQQPSTDQPARPRSPTTGYKSSSQLELERLGPYVQSDWEFYDPYHSKHKRTGKIFSNVNIDVYRRGN